MRARHDTAALISVVALALAASATSITNGFAFDDIHILFENEAVHSLSRWWTFFTQSYWPAEKGGDLYRPWTMLIFAIQWAIGGGSPLTFHVTSIALYALTCAAFFLVAVRLLPLAGAWLASALFAVHPVHVEVVGNVVGQGELWAAAFMFLGIAVFLRARCKNSMSAVEALVIVLCYALGLISKEHVIVLPAVLLAAELTVMPRARPLRRRLIELRPLLLLMAAIALAFIWARLTVLAHTRGVPPAPAVLFLNQPFSARALTMLSVALEWVRLLLWPAQLSADYSPRHIRLVSGPTLQVLVSMVVIGAIGALAWITRRTAPLVTFSILWLGIALAIPSNLIVVTGFVLAERTLFVASAAAMLCVGFVATRLVPELKSVAEVPRRLIIVAVAGVIVTGAVASALRQRVWRDNATLFAQMIKDAPTSFNARLYYSTVLFERKQVAEGFKQLGIAHSLYPDEITVLEYGGAQYAQAHACPVAMRLFRQVLEKDSRRLRSRTGLVSCMIMLGQHDSARKAIREGLATGEPENALRQLRHINDSVERAARLKAGSAPPRGRE